MLRSDCSGRKIAPEGRAPGEDLMNDAVIAEVRVKLYSAVISDCPRRPRLHTSCAGVSVKCGGAAIAAGDWSFGDVDGTTCSTGIEGNGLLEFRYAFACGDRGEQRRILPAGPVTSLVAVVAVPKRLVRATKGAVISKDRSAERRYLRVRHPDLLMSRQRQSCQPRAFRQKIATGPSRLSY